ncbi:hypothetical protein BJ508DRAFT_381680 [Ascobolus immersus RN42]|uniref:Uncharacterized protein n=1 Tax=Ascobolus immersus RN42 TaxID=1160509 RepID=A0A3N4HD20_ASCIM|nr:hypothetical protein BJ508DRAFT_381680 [Ascobolus immersus RN42]
MQFSLPLVLTFVSLLTVSEAWKVKMFQDANCSGKSHSTIAKTTIPFCEDYVAKRSGVNPAKSALITLAARERVVFYHLKGCNYAHESAIREDGPATNRCVNLNNGRYGWGYNVERF